MTDDLIQQRDRCTNERLDAAECERVMRVCKSCRFLERYTFAKSGSVSDLHDDYGFRCGWAKQQDYPWAEAFMRTRASQSGAGIGKRHVEGDWSEEMDCPTWAERRAQ